MRSSRKPLPPLAQPPLQLPKPPPASHYDGYLKSIAPLYDTFRHSEASPVAGPSSITLDSDAGISQAGTDLPALSNVPDVFFDSNFNLANPSTWAAIADGPGTEDSAGSSNADTRLEDDLSTHLDVLERHLVHEITLRSTAFFSALSNLQDLHSESSSCLSRISSLQTSLQDIGSKQAKKGLNIIEQHEQLKVLRRTDAGVRQVVDLEDLMRIARDLVDAGDWSGGLGCLQDVVRWWESHRLKEEDTESVKEKEGPSSVSANTASAQPLPLSTLPALASLPPQFSALTTSVAAQLQSSLNALLLSVLSHADTSNFDAESFGHSVRPMLAGLTQCGKSDGLEEVWRDVLTTSIREGSRKVSAALCVFAEIMAALASCAARRRGR